MHKYSSGRTLSGLHNTYKVAESKYPIIPCGLTAIGATSGTYYPAQMIVQYSDGIYITYAYVYNPMEFDSEIVRENGMYYIVSE